MCLQELSFDNRVLQDLHIMKPIQKFNKTKTVATDIKSVNEHTVNRGGYVKGPWPFLRLPII